MYCNLKINIRKEFYQMIMLDNSNEKSIFRAVHRHSQEVLVLKITSTKNIMFTHHDIEREAWCLDNLNHANLHKSNRAVVEAMGLLSCRFTSVKNHEVLIQQHANKMDMFEFMIQHPFLKEKYAKAFMCQTLGAVQHLHNHGIAHMDIKLENIFLNQHTNSNIIVVKLADFSLSKLESFGDNIQTLTEPCGTGPYMAPEMLDGGAWVDVAPTTMTRDDFDFQNDSCHHRDVIKFNGYKTDMWALGICFFVMVCGIHPIDEATPACKWFRYLFISHDQFWTHMGECLKLKKYPVPSLQFKEILQATLAPQHQRVNVNSLVDFEFFQ